jgi:hypothetical protein
MRASPFVLLLVLVASSHVFAQDCPKATPDGPLLESSSRKLTGKVVFHNDLRQWLSLELDAPVCGTEQIQLLEGGGGFEVDEGNSHSFEVFRGCRVTVIGTLGLPGTGYYSADLYQNVVRIEPSAGCIQQTAFPDYSNARPAPGVRRYRVKMWFYYGAEDPVHASVTTGDHALGPWQGYASYLLTGGFVFYAYCADNFSMIHLVATRATKPWTMDNYAILDPEGAAAKHVRRIQLSYTCRR